MGSLLLTPDQAEQLNQYYKTTASPQDRAAIRRYLGSQSFYNFVRIYLPHHFSLSIEKLNEIDPINKYWTSAQKENIAGKVLINKTNDETFKVFGQIFKKKHINRVLIKPRGTGKTTEVQGLVIWLLAYQVYHYFLYGSCTLSDGHEKLSDIRQEIESNELLQNDFPHLTPGKTKLTNTQIGWTQHGITFENMKLQVIGYPKGRGKKFKYYRPEIVIFDDLDDDESAQSPEIMKKMTNWFEKVVLSLGGITNLSILIVGTLFDERSLINRVARGEIGKFEVNKIALIENNESTWPEVWTMQRLMDKKSEIGSTAFSCEFLNEPLPEGSRPFSMKYINKCIFEMNSLKITDRSRIIIFADLPEKFGNDYMGLIAVYKSTDNLYYVIDAIIENENTPHQRLEVIYNFVVKWGCSIIGIEENNQTMFIDSLKTKFLNNNKAILVESIRHTSKKEIRIISILQPLIESGRMFFLKEEKYKTTYLLLIEQLLQFPQGKHDDAPDALAGCIEVFNKYYSSEEINNKVMPSLNSTSSVNDYYESMLNYNKEEQLEKEKQKEEIMNFFNEPWTKIINKTIEWQDATRRDDAQDTIRKLAKLDNGFINFVVKKGVPKLTISENGLAWQEIKLQPFQVEQLIDSIRDPNRQAKVISPKESNSNNFQDIKKISDIKPPQIKSETEYTQDSITHKHNTNDIEIIKVDMTPEKTKISNNKAKRKQPKKHMAKTVAKTD